MIDSYTQSDPGLYSTSDLAVIFETSVTTVCNWVKAGLPICEKRGTNNQFYFDMDGVGTWIKENKPKKYKCFASWKKRKENES